MRKGKMIVVALHLTMVTIIGLVVTTYSQLANAGMDPIVGTWKLDRKFVTYQDQVNIKTDGTYVRMVFGSEMKGA